MIELRECVVAQYNDERVVLLNPPGSRWNPREVDKDAVYEWIPWEDAMRFTKEKRDMTTIQPNKTFVHHSKGESSPFIPIKGAVPFRLKLIHKTIIQLAIPVTRVEWNFEDEEE
jgi:hypothetical protein